MIVNNGQYERRVLTRQRRYAIVDTLPKEAKKHPNLPVYMTLSPVRVFLQMKTSNKYMMWEDFYIAPVCSHKGKVRNVYMIYFPINETPIKNRQYSVHRLLAETFISNPNNYDCVLAKDFNYLNLDINNLMWANKLAKRDVVCPVCHEVYKSNAVRSSCKKCSNKRREEKRLLEKKECRERHLKELKEEYGDILRHVDKWNDENKERNISICKDFMNGNTLRAIGDKHGISYERVRHIVEKIRRLNSRIEYLEKHPPQPIPPNSIKHLGLSTRSFNCLNRYPIKTIDEIEGKTEEELMNMNIRNLGKLTAHEIVEKIANYKRGQ